MKKLLLLMLFVCVSIIVYGQGTVTKLAKNYDSNNPSYFWYRLWEEHPQIKAMKQAIDARKPAMVIAANEIGTFSIRNEARKEASKSNKYVNIVERLYYITGIRERFGNVEFFIVNNNEENASMYPDGTCIVYSGLIDNSSDEEIVAIIAHEIAHYVLSHSINDSWRTAKAVRRNQTWANIGTGLAMGVYAGSQIYSAQYGVSQSNAAQQQMYNNIAAAGERIRNEIGLSTNVYTRLRYMRETEEEADETAFWFLEKNGIDPQNLINVFKRLDRNTPAYLKKAKKTKYSSHPDMTKRIQNIENLYKKYHSQNFTQNHIKIKETFNPKPIDIGAPNEGDILRKIKEKARGARNYASYTMST